MSSINGMGQGLQAFLQNLSDPQSQGVGQPLNPDGTDTNPLNGANPFTPGEFPPPPDGSGNFQKIAEAVTAALQNSQSSSSSSDPNQVIQNAIVSVLQGGQSLASNTDSSSSAAPTTPTSTTGPQAFMQMLEGYGVSASQFHQDLKAAMQSVFGDQSGSSSQNFLPPGTLVSAMG